MSISPFCAKMQNWLSPQKAPPNPEPEHKEIIDVDALLAESVSMEQDESDVYEEMERQALESFAIYQAEQAVAGKRKSIEALEHVEVEGEGGLCCLSCWLFECWG